MYKFITESEYNKLAFKPRQGHIKTQERLAIEAMKVGQIALWKKNEWTLKSAPGHICHAVKKQLGYRFKSRELLGGGICS